MTKILYIAIGVGMAVIIALAGAWFFFLKEIPTQPSTNNNNSFGTPTTNTTNTTNTSNTTGSSNTTESITSSQNSTLQKIFQITADPVVGATFIQTLHPTTTLVRYISATNGHVFDLPLDVPGAIPRVVSNITIPGGVRTIWLEQGNAAVMQYLDGDTIKSVYLGFPTQNGSTTKPTKIQFLSNNIMDIAASPDGKSIAYLFKTANGSDGYIAKSDGTGSKKLFSLPLSQMLISWPSTNALLAQTKSAVGVMGTLFSVDVKSGAVALLVNALGLTATADSSLSQIMYQTTATESAPITLVRDGKKGTDRKLSLTPYPEKCIWSIKTLLSLYCASPLAPASTYLDSWHMGYGGVDTILSYNLNTGVTLVQAMPGSSDGGAQANILELSLSSDEHYLGYVVKGERSLWGVRLAQ